MLLFTADWCEPCSELKRWLIQKGYEVAVIDIDEEFELAQSNGVNKLPTLVHDRHVLIGREEIKPYLEELYD